MRHQQRKSLWPLVVWMTAAGLSASWATHAIDETPPSEITVTHVEGQQWTELKDFIAYTCEARHYELPSTEPRFRPLPRIVPVSPQ